MKTRSVTRIARSIALIGLLWFTTTSLSAQNPFERLSESQHITSVIVHKGILQMASNIPGMELAGGLQLKDIISKLDAVEIYTSNNKRGANLVDTEANKYFKNNKSLETLMQVKQADQTVRFYGEKGRRNNFSSMIMYVSQSDQVTLIRMRGDFTIQDIQKITKQSK